MISVLVVEDDSTVARIHSRVVERVPGFVVIGVAHTGGEAIARAQEEEPHLVVLDLYLPDISGLEVLRRIRGHGLGTDVIVISAAREAEIVREVLRAGAVDYLVKPFRVERLTQSLEEYRLYREEMASAGGDLPQEQIDRMMGRLGREPAAGLVPPAQKGIDPATLARITGALQREGRGLTADEVVSLTNLSRTTVNRYLRHLAATGQVRAEPVYGSVGRPELVYQLEG
ncbi:MAG: response regulator [Bacillota bacterium]